MQTFFSTSGVDQVRAKLSVVAAGIGLLLVATAPLWAHHSFWVEFDVNQPVVLKGTITKVEWINPHAWLHLDVKSPDGGVEAWMIEGGSAAALLTRGFTTRTLLPGMVVSVEGYRSKNRALRANGGDITFADGTTLFFAFSKM